ncbi:MAG: HDOD domain-containing protein, partial [Acidobacteria bacterium]|nr:HDOD domain-containing protein [Acidobacteriota bacterium]
LPPFSPMLSKLVAAMAQENISFSELAGMIERDTVIAAHVLRVVNSAAYGHTRTIGSIRHALTLMGLTKLHNTVLGLSVSRMWMSVRTARGWNPRTFNEHSVATGILADLLATTLPTNYPEGAFIAGLLHDIGKLLIAISFPDEFEQIDRLCRERPDLEHHEHDLLGFGHADLSASALTRWNLPVEVQEAVRFHHAPGKAANRPGQIPLSLIVHSADALANALHLELFPVEQDEPVQQTARVFESLGIPDRAGTILEEFEREFIAMRAAL